MLTIKLSDIVKLLLDEYSVALYLEYKYQKRIAVLTPSENK